MENKIQEVRCISKTDLLDNNFCNMKEAMQIIEKTLIDNKNGNIIMPNKTSLILDENTQSRINCMSAVLLNEKVSGVKWISVMPQNPIKYNIPNVNGVIILSNIENGLPLAFMDGTLCTNLRTAAIGGIAAKYLANKDAETIGFIGSGEQAKNHLIAMKTVLPNLKICKVSSKSSDSEGNFIKCMKEKFPEMKFIQCNSNYENAIVDSDIIITATSGQDQILKAKWIKKGAFYCHVAGLEDEFDVPKIADKIVCDDWENVKHRKQTISVMYQKGMLKDEDIYANLVEIIAKEKLGREKKDEFIYFNSVGLAYIDIAIANEIYKKCVKNNIGSIINI